MRVERIILTVLVISAGAMAAINWRKAALFQSENEKLLGRIEALENEASQSSKEKDLAKAQAEKARGQSSELLQLRNEVTQLRSASATAQTLTAENQRLRGENQQLRTGAANQPAAGAA